MGVVVACWTARLRDEFLVLLGGLMALREGLRLVVEKGLSITIVETDASVVVPLYRSCDSFSSFFSCYL
ncbi:hypothetical protein TorRG33x02_152830 [Trema orientale]|uniref:Uncharacterized protein n=1 Tax=Trema orientale TaxID=63057 RepID=A0A2P5ETM4_TREOI|nr:hypothetical protein TorRG33x02_152830 [Trema orientale]